jgi:ABC-type sugar transport system ATPase subunit
VGAKAEVHALMGRLAQSGVGIIMISSELPEILGMSDRVLVMAEGQVAAILDQEEATQEAIMAYASGEEIGSSIAVDFAEPEVRERR